MSSVVSNWWVWITSRLWRACHKSRESDTWWEVSEMILACNLQLQKIDPWNKGCLCMLPWEKKPMHASQFCSVPEGTDQLSCTCKKCSIAWRKCSFLAGSWVDYLGDLCTLWAEQLTATQICKNFGMSSPTGENCAILVESVNWQNCAILEFSRLLKKIRQFLEGRIVSL